MTEAGKVVTGGFPVRTDAEVVRWPDRYMDAGGKGMWERVIGVLGPEERPVG